MDNYCNLKLGLKNNSEKREDKRIFWMGFLGDSIEESGRGGRSSRVGFKALIRRKQVDSAHSSSSSGHHQLARELSIPHLISIGTHVILCAFNFVLILVAMFSNS